MWQERCGACLLFSVALLLAKRHVLFISLSLLCFSRRAPWRQPWQWRLHSRPQWLWPPRGPPSLPPSQCSRHRQASQRPPELQSCPRFVPSTDPPLSLRHLPQPPKGSAAMRLAVSKVQPTPSPYPLLHYVTQLGMDGESHTCPHTFTLISQSYFHTAWYPRTHVEAKTHHKHMVVQSGACVLHIDTNITHVNASELVTAI